VSTSKYIGSSTGTTVRHSDKSAVFALIRQESATPPTNRLNLHPPPAAPSLCHNRIGLRVDGRRNGPQKRSLRTCTTRYPRDPRAWPAIWAPRHAWRVSTRTSVGTCMQDHDVVNIVVHQHRVKPWGWFFLKNELQMCCAL
jgi:hypothetical protein